MLDARVLLADQSELAIRVAAGDVECQRLLDQIREERREESGSQTGKPNILHQKIAKDNAGPQMDFVEFGFSI
ncbi:hypothetical protein GYA13_05235 [Candidatus Kuenenbacteria bacterium]|nr:hypothetical protein [Candidatus Kuenenbacteria bacterium]